MKNKYDWSILSGNLNFEPHQYKIKKLNNNGTFIELEISEEDLMREFNEDNENYNDYYYIYYHYFSTLSLSELNYNLELKGFEITTNDLDLYVRKRYKDSEILKNILNDICYLHNYFLNDINDENIKECLQFNKNKNLEFTGFKPLIDKKSGELYFFL